MKLKKIYLIVIFLCLLFFYLGYIVHPYFNEQNTNTSQTNVASNSLVYVEDFSKKNSEADDTGRIQRAIDYAKNKGINTVLLGAKTYETSYPLKVYSNLKLLGENRTTTIIISTGDIPTIASEGYFSAGKGSSDIQIENIGIHPRGVNKKTHYAIEMVNTFSSVVKNCHISELGMAKTDVGGIRFSKDEKYKGNHFVNAVRESQLSNASIVMESTDSYIESNEVWGHSKSFAIHLVKSSQLVANNQIVGSSIHGGIWVEDTKNGNEVELIKITNNYFDGSYEEVDSGAGIIANKMKSSSISGNNFWRQKDEGIHLIGGFSNSITGNTFTNNNRRDDFRSDIKIESRANVISGNTFHRNMVQTNKGKALEIINNSPDKNTVLGNRVFFTGNYLASTLDDPGAGGINY